MSFQGRTDVPINPDHRVRITLNNTVLGEGTWDGATPFQVGFDIPQGTLREGGNTVRVESLALENVRVDLVYDNWLEIVYPRKGLRDKKVGAAAESKKEEERFHRHSERLRDNPDGADYLIITKLEFIGTVSALAAHRREQGHRVRVASVEAVYTEFSDGSANHKAIKSFVRYALENWSEPKLKYVVLAGDGSYDPEDYLKGDKKDLVPAHLTFSKGFGLVPDDQWYVTFDDDANAPTGLQIGPPADLKIGRLPAQDKETLGRVIARIVEFENRAELRKRAVFVADGEEKFETLANGLIDRLPEDWEADKVFRRGHQDARTTGNEIVARFNEGAALAVYVGHGYVKGWAKEYMFTPQHIEKLADNGDLGLVVQLTCLSGFFASPNAVSMAESFLLNPQAGAAATIAPTGQIYTAEHERFGAALFTELFDKNVPDIGTALGNAKRAAKNNGVKGEVLRTYVLLGDPAMPWLLNKKDQ